MNCHNCNNPLSDSSKFCSVCGQPVPQTPVEETPQATQGFIPQETQAAEAPQPQETQGYASQEEFYPQTEQVPPQTAYQSQPAQDYSAQYQQYQQPSPYGNSQFQYGGQPPQKSRTPLIIVIIVLAVLLIGGGITAAILIFNANKGNDNSNNESSAASVTIQDSGTEIESSDDESSAISVIIPHGRNEVVNSDGLKLYEDPDIDSLDTVSEEKIASEIERSRISQEVELGVMNIYIYAQGNALVYEYRYTEPISSSEKEDMRGNAEELPSKSADTLANLRTQTGVDNMVMVYAYIDADGSLFTSAICK